MWIGMGRNPNPWTDAIRHRAVHAIARRPPRGESGLGGAAESDFALLLPACAAAQEAEIGVEPMVRGPDGFRWRTRSQIEEGRSWVWFEGGLIRFKAEASAWTPSA